MWRADALLRIARGVLCLFPVVLIQASGIRNVVSSADAIVVGSITMRIESADRVSFDIDVQRILKGGPLPPVVHVNHAWTRMGLVIPSTAKAVNVAILGVWALHRTNSPSTWDVLAVNGPGGFMPGLFLPAVRELPSPYQYSSSTLITDVLAFEVGAAVKTSGLNPEIFLYAAKGLDTSAVRAIFSDFLASPIVAFQSVGLTGMLERGQRSSVAKLVALWPSISKDPNRSYVLSALRDSFRDIAPEPVQQLSSIAGTSSTSSELKSAIISALAAIHTHEALPFLASLLMSTDPAERMKGVFGLSSFANGCVQQTPDNVVSMTYLQLPASSPYQTSDTIANFAFRRGPDAQEAALRSFWTSWWDDHPELH